MRSCPGCGLTLQPDLRGVYLRVSPSPVAWPRRGRVACRVVDSDRRSQLVVALLALLVVAIVVLDWTVGLPVWVNLAGIAVVVFLVFAGPFSEWFTRKTDA